MREIKFRVWNSSIKKMLYLESTTEAHNHYIQVGSGGFWLYDSTKGNLMAKQEAGDILLQYAGLKDKNGKEIYEGDILQIETANHTVVRMTCAWGTVQRKMDTGWLVDITGVHFCRTDGLAAFPIVENWNGKRDLEMLEVIGNIYETPELLTNE